MTDKNDQDRIQDWLTEKFKEVFKMPEGDRIKRIRQIVLDQVRRDNPPPIQVICDETNNSKEDVEAGVLNVTFVQPYLHMEFKVDPSSEDSVDLIKKEAGPK